MNSNGIGDLWYAALCGGGSARSPRCNSTPCRSFIVWWHHRQDCGCERVELINAQQVSKGFKGDQDINLPAFSCSVLAFCCTFDIFSFHPRRQRTYIYCKKKFILAVCVGSLFMNLKDMRWFAVVVALMSHPEHKYDMTPRVASAFIPLCFCLLSHVWQAVLSRMTEAWWLNDIFHVKKKKS